ncbi:hypothetical protein EMPG_11435, partial [Blastomyces silverae]
MGLYHQAFQSDKDGENQESAQAEHGKMTQLPSPFYLPRVEEQEDGLYAGSRRGGLFMRHRPHCRSMFFFYIGVLLFSAVGAVAYEPPEPTPESRQVIHFPPSEDDVGNHHIDPTTVWRTITKTVTVPAVATATPGAGGADSSVFVTSILPPSGSIIPSFYEGTCPPPPDPSPPSPSLPTPVPTTS